MRKVMSESDENKTTPFSNKTAILADLWLNYRSDEDFEDFVEYNDLGLPLAYIIENGIVESTETAARFIEETFDLLLEGLDIEDTGFEDLDEIFAESSDSDGDDDK
jgi:hypothetical protein